MAFDRPSLSTLVARIENDFISRLPLSGAVLARSMVRVLSRVIAGAAHMLHGHLEWASKQIAPSDDMDEEYVIRWASLFGLTKNEATFATGTVTITGSNGETIPTGTVLVRSDSAEYTVDADVTIAGGTATADVTASEAGEDGTLTVGVMLSFESPIAGVDSTCEVASSTADGTDEESTEGLLARLQERMADPANGGTEADYIAWAKEVTGVTRVWVEPLGLGPGTVLVYFARDDDASPIPDAGEVTAVQNKMDEEAPAHATVTVAAPTASATDFTFSAISPDTAAVKAAVEAELEDLILTEGEPGGTILLSAIRTAIGNAAGITDYTLTTPAADVNHSAGELPTMGTVTWP